MLVVTYREPAPALTVYEWRDRGGVVTVRYWRRGAGKGGYWAKRSLGFRVR